jgi:hypothetical protein
VYAKLHRRGVTGGMRRLFAPVLTAMFFAGLAALPTASAASSPVTPSVIASEGGGAIDIPVGQLTTIASSLPVADLGLTPVELEKTLTSLPGLTGLNVVQTTLLQTLLAALPAGATLNGLLQGVSGGLGVKLAPVELLDALVGAAQNPGEVAGILGDLAGSLSSTQLTELQGILGAITGALTSGELTQLQSSLQSLLGGLGTGKLTSILSPLEGVLTGTDLTQLQALLKNLGSLTPSQLQAELQGLLGGLSTGELSELLTQVFGALNPTEVRPLLGGLLGGLSFSTTTAGQLASTLGMPLQTLATDVGTPSEELPSTLGALTAPLGEKGQLLSLLDGLGGLSLSVLNPSHSEETKGSEGAGEAGGSASGGSGSSNGGSGTSPGGSSTTGTTLVVNVPGAVPASAVAAAAKSSAKKPGKVKILSHKVKGDVATLVISVPAAGKLTLTGRGARSVRHKASKASRITVRVLLSKAGTASLRKHRNRLKVKLKASFAPSSGARSSATSTVTFA